MKEKIKKFSKFVVLCPVRFFRACISPFLPHSCIFVPSCSKYMIEAVNEYGIFKGLCLGIWRILRCNPFQKKRGYDPVKINIKGENAWLL